MAEQVRSLKTHVMYKDTPVGRIPVDWEVVRLGDVCDVVGGSTSTASTRNKKYRGVVIPSTIPKDTTDSRSNVISAEELRCNERADNVFVLYGMIFFQHRLEKHKNNIISKRFPKKDISSLLLPLPPICEQKGITEILRTVDEAIEKTKVIVENTKELHKGMMLELFTRRTGHEKPKKAEIREIPKGWELVMLKDIARKFCRAGTPDTTNKEYWDGDIPWISGADVENQRVQRIQRHISLGAVEKGAANIVPKGSLLVVTRTGVGKLAVAPCDVAVSQEITGIVLNADRAFPVYIYWYLTYKAPRLRSLLHGTSTNSLATRDLESFLILLPPLQEQRKIALILSCIDNEIEQEANYREQLEVLKKGLMRQLLTGKIRVPRA